MRHSFQRASAGAGLIVAVAALALGLAACGGGGSSGQPAPAPTTIPVPGANIDPNANGVLTGPINEARRTAADADKRQRELEQQTTDPDTSR